MQSDYNNWWNSFSNCVLTNTLDFHMRIFQHVDSNDSNYISFLSVLSVGEIRRGKGKQVSCLKINISANTEISNEMTRMSFTQLCRSNNLTEGKMSSNIFLCLPVTLAPLIYTVNKCFFLSVWNCMEDWTMLFEALQPAYKYIINI